MQDFFPSSARGRHWDPFASFEESSFGISGGGFGGFGGGFAHHMTSHMGGGSHMSSVQTQIVNGQQRTVRTEVRNGVKTVTVEENGRITEKYVNDVPQLVGGRETSGGSLEYSVEGDAYAEKTPRSSYQSR
jgi:hypothetical protein